MRQSRCGVVCIVIIRFNSLHFSLAFYRRNSRSISQLTKLPMRNQNSRLKWDDNGLR